MERKGKGRDIYICSRENELKGTSNKTVVATV